MRLTVGAKTDVGRVREGNEDSYLVDSPLFVVADGMGGHLAGDVASAIAVDVIQNRANEQAPDAGSLGSLVEQANQAIYEKAQAERGLEGMGTTCTLIMVDGGTAHIAHVGDSRAYLLRDGRLQQLTEDHTLVARMVKEGRLRPEDADHHPQRSIITRALGVEAQLKVDLQTIELMDGDRLLLCSDGLTAMLDQDSIRDILASEADPQTAAERLVERANEAGGEDNITVVVVDVGADRGESEETAPPAAVRRSPAPIDEAEARAAGPPKGRRRALGMLAGALVIAGLLFASARYALSNSWFVGASEDGYVTIFQGRPEEIAGFDLRNEEEKTEVSIEELPTQTLQENVREGIKAESREDAEEIVGNLTERVREAQETPNRPNSRKRS